MADYFIQFSCVFSVGTAENAEKADEIRGELAAELYRHEGTTLGFEIQADHEAEPGTICIYSDEYCEPEHVTRFVLLCAEAFKLTGLWGFTWCRSCSKPRPGGFGGGALLFNLGRRRIAGSFECSDWLAEQISKTSAYRKPRRPRRQNRPPP
jgi:hypothetical protein